MAQRENIVKNIAIRYKDFALESSVDVVYVEEIAEYFIQLKIILVK